MSGVDVLKLMDFMLAQDAKLVGLQEARAAVAELIEAGEEFAACDSLEAQKRFKSALSRVRGAE